MTLDARVDRFDLYLEHLRAGVPFALSRWGDGEWACLLGQTGANCDGQPYTAALRRDLTDVLRSRPIYFLGLQGFAVRQVGPAMVAWLEAEGLSLSWVEADSFASRSRAGTLVPFIRALDARDVILVGPDYLQALALFPVAAHVVMPAQAVHEREIDRLVRETTAAHKAAPGAVIAVSAGLTANVLVHAVATFCPDATILDCGSLWEPYVGRVSRTYHRAVLGRVAVPA